MAMAHSISKTPASPMANWRREGDRSARGSRRDDRSKWAGWQRATLIVAASVALWGGLIALVFAGLGLLG
ncbi:hypothetical protein MMB232_01141 [Brevundimonas subvibrioides]